MNDMKENKFELPELIVINFTDEDIITDSGDVDDGTPTGDLD